MPYMTYAIKIFLTVLIILGASEAAKRLPAAGALINALPLMSVIVMCMLYYDTRDGAKVAEYARAVPPLVIPSIAFFYVFAFLVEYGLGFVMAMGLATLVMLSGYGLYMYFFARTGM